MAKTLIQQIEAKRSEMVERGMAKGLSHPETVCLSQELDELLNKLGKTKLNNGMEGMENVV